MDQLPVNQSHRAFMRINLTSEDQSACTPPGVYALISAMFGVRGAHDFFDPCPLGGSAADAATDGLRMPWGRLNYVNPPFRDAALWLDKAALEASRGGCTSVVLLPARTHTRYMHLHGIAHADAIIILTDGVRFMGYKKDFSMPIMLLVFGLAHHPGGLLAPGHVRARRVPAFGAYIPDMTLAALQAWARARWGPEFDETALDVTRAEQLDRVVATVVGPDGRERPSARRCLVFVLADSQACVTRLLEHHRRFASSGEQLCTVGVWMCRYSTRWFQELAAHMSEFVMLSRCLKLSDRHKGSILGSCVAVLASGAPPRPGGPAPGVVVPRGAPEVTFYSKGSRYGE